LEIKLIGRVLKINNWKSFKNKIIGRVLKINN